MFFNKKITIYLVFSFTLFLGFLLEENSSGGAKIDHEILLPYINNFSLNFSKGLEIFLNNPVSLIHSPVFYIISGFFLKITENLIIVKIFYIIVSLTLPYFFFKILKQKFQTENFFIFYLSLIIFLSPFFRTSAIWLLGDNLSLIFFSLSILFFLKFDQNKENDGFIFLSIGFLIACCYIRYYYCIFYFYYLYYFLKNLDKRFLFKILFFSFFLSTPALFYFFYVITEFNFFQILSITGKMDYFNSAITILSMILFYAFPFLIDKDLTVLNYYKKRIKIVFVYIFIFLIIYILNFFLLVDFINFSEKGGGVFIKFFRLLDISESFGMLFTAFISLILLDFIFKNDRVLNYLLLFILIASLPMATIYQKYLDPLFFLVFFGLINSDYIKQNILKKKFNLKFIFSYFFSFYLFSLFYYLS